MEVTLYDAHGRKISQKPVLEELARPTVGGIRSTLSSYPSHGLTPVTLARILKEADQGDVHRQMELFEEIEEKDPHIFSVFQTRKLAVAGLDWEVKHASESASDKDIADFVKSAIEGIDNWDDALKDLLDAVGKGYAISEIIWKVRDKKALISELAWRHQKWFTFDVETVSEIRLLTEKDSFKGEELLPFKFAIHRHKARSGILPRVGLIRTLAFYYLFKNYDIKDWVTFAEVFGMPLRLGKFPAGASEKDKEILLQAVTQLGHDAAAIIPEGMLIEFQEATKSGNVNFYEALAEFCDKAASKAVLGQTLTTEQGKSGSYSLGKVHDEVRFDILEADAKALGKTINRDLVLPLVYFNFGPQESYPIFKFHLEEPEDLKELSEVVGNLVEAGAGKVIPANWINDKFKIPKPKDDEETLELTGDDEPINAKGILVDGELVMLAGKKKLSPLLRMRSTK